MVDLETSRNKVAALLAPRNVAIVGASDRPGNWAARVWRNLNRYDFPGPIYPINPKRETLWDTTCYPDVAALPEPPDHLAVLVPAKLVPDLLTGAAAAGARSATIFTSGFEESPDEEGRALGRRLAEVIGETGIAVSGPNCLGNLSARSRLVTMTEDRPLNISPGPAALIGQSGGVMMFTNHVLAERGITAGYVVSSGNETGLTSGDYIAYFAEDADTRVIVSYLEAVRDPETFLAACRAARDAGKPVVMVKLGQSEEGRKAAIAHTGMLAGAIEAFDAAAGEAGVLRVDSLDDLVETVEYLIHAAPPQGPRLGALTLSGAYRGLLLDAADRNNLLFPELAPATRAKLEKRLGVGSIVGNPLDGGFAILTSEETYIACIDIMQEDPNIDMILLQEELPRREQGADRTRRYLKIAEDYAAGGAKKPIVFVSVLSHSQNEHSRDLRAALPHLAFLQEANKSLRTIGNVLAWRERGERAREAETLAAPPAPAASTERWRREAAQGGATRALDEVTSKALLTEYGIEVPREILARTAEAAVEAAKAIGYPVVLKGVSADLAHKSEAGAVLMNLGDGDQVRDGFGRIGRNVAAWNADITLDGILVCQQVSGGIELALGIHRDPEVGLVIMAGTGGVWLELYKDVAFAAPPLSPAKAADMIARTRMAQLLEGYRGAAAADSGAVIDALLALGRIAVDLHEIIESVDINPFVALPGGGAMALDALVVVRGGGESGS